MKKNLLFILHLPPPIHGASMVGKYIVESEEINSHFNIDYINLSTSVKINEIGYGNLKKLFKFLTLLKNILKSIISKDYNHCYITFTLAGLGFYKDLFIVFVLKIFKKKIIYHFHNKGINANSKKGINHLLYKILFKKSKNILLSPSLFYEFKRYINLDSKVFYCPNGIPAQIEDLNFAPNPYRNNDKCKILFLSNMIIDKGVIILLNACKKLKERLIEFECHFVGAWSDISESDFNKLVLEYNLKDYVFAHGPKFNTEKQLFFENAEIFVLPTFYKNECFPLVLLEAMKFNLPIISTSEGGIPDIVENNKTGFIIQPNNLNQLIEKLEILITNPLLRKQFGSEGNIRFVDLFTINEFEKKFIDIISICIKD